MNRSTTMRNLLFLLIGMLLVSGGVKADTPPTGFLNKTATVNGTAYPYVVYVPRDFKADKKWPVILFLHGSGERGDDGLKQSQVGIGSAIRMNPERFPALV